MQCFSCSVPCEDQLDGECLIIFSSYYILCPQPGARSEGVVYPGEVLVNVELQSQPDSDSIACSVETDTSTSCTAIITRDVSVITGDASTDTTRDDYTVTVNQTNDYGSTINMSSFDGRTVLTPLLWAFALCPQHSLLIVSLPTANILLITDLMVGPDDDQLSITVAVNELCPPDREYDVLVTFGTRPRTGGDSDCQGQMNASTTIPSDDSATLSVSADTVDRESNEVYCFVVRVDGTIGEYIHLLFMLVITG